MSYAIKPHLEGAFKNRNIFSQIKRHFFQFLRETVVLWGGNTADTINHCDLCHASSAPSNTLSQGPLSCGPLWLVLGSNKSYSMSQLLCACVFYFSPWIAESAFLRRGFHRLGICRDRRDRRSCKIFVSCVIFFRKQRSFLLILQVYTHLNVNFLHNC